MEIFEKNSKLIQRLNLIIILIGIIEIFILLFFSDKIFLVLYGLLTIVPAYFTYSNNYKKRNYLVVIMTFVKYNPFSLILFILYAFDLFNIPKHDQSPMMSLMPLAAIIMCGGLITVGVFLIIRIRKHNKLIDANITKETTKS